jgi:hypothetical protein
MIKNKTQYSFNLFSSVQRADQIFGGTPIIVSKRIMKYYGYIYDDNWFIAKKEDNVPYDTATLIFEFFCIYTDLPFSRSLYPKKNEYC